MPLNKRLTSKQQYWLDHINAAEESQQSMAVYAQKHNLPIKNFYNARSALKRRGLLGASNGAFVLAKPGVTRPAKAPSSTSINILFENGIQCQVNVTGDDVDAMLQRIKLL